MDDLLVPDTPAGQRSRDGSEQTGSKLKTFPIKLFSVIHIVCGALSCGLGIAAYLMECNYSELFIPVIAGIIFVATGANGMFVKKHGCLQTFYGCFSLASILFSIGDVVTMFSAMSAGENDYQTVCTSYDCLYSHRFDNCCEDYIEIPYWGNLAIELSILVVAVVEMVASTLSLTLSLRNADRKYTCINLKKNMVHPDSTPSNQSAPTTTCGPCDGICHRNITIILSSFHIIMGVFSVAMGIWAVFVDCIFATIAIPIWSGILIFGLTGVCGLLCVKYKGVYVPCFFSLTVLSVICSINMMVWMPITIHGFEDSVCVDECGDWSCNSSTSSTSFSNFYYNDFPCHNCPEGCCYMDYVCDDQAYDVKILVDKLTFAVAVIEFLVSLGSLVLIFTQLRCCACCDGQSCCSCDTKPNDQYMIMGSDGNLSTVAISNVHRGTSVLTDQNQFIMAQNPQVANGQVTVGRPVSRNSRLPQQPNYQDQTQGIQPSVVHFASDQPNMAQGQNVIPGGQMFPVVAQAKTLPVYLQGHGQPVLHSSSTTTAAAAAAAAEQQTRVQGHVAMDQCYASEQPMLINPQLQPMFVQQQPVLHFYQQPVAQAHQLVAHAQQQPVVQAQQQQSVVQTQQQPVPQA